MSDVTLKEFEGYVDGAYKLKSIIDEKEAEIKGLNESLKLLQDKIILQMKNFEKTSYKHKFGTVVLTTRFSIKNPNEPDKKKEFFDFLRERGIFEDMVSVNSMRLNAFYKEELENAKSRGDFDFSIPGLGLPSSVEYITFRKG